MRGSRTTGQRDSGSVLARLAVVLRQISGMPDYAGFVQHLCRCHPDTPIPTEREYYNEYLSSRYGDGPTRCC
ncbi:MAG: YbdD/YjiX family protein [Gemmatimonadales bacterium]